MTQCWERLGPASVSQGSILARCHTNVCGLSLLFVLVLLWGFFSGFSGFPPSSNTNISKFQFDQDRGPAWKPASSKADVASSLNLFHLFSTCTCTCSPVPALSHTPFSRDCSVVRQRVGQNWTNTCNAQKITTKPQNSENTGRGTNTPSTTWTHL